MSFIVYSGPYCQQKVITSNALISVQIPGPPAGFKNVLTKAILCGRIRASGNAPVVPIRPSLKVTNVSAQADASGSESSFVGFYYGDTKFGLDKSQTWSHTFDFTSPNDLAQGIPLNHTDSVNTVETEHLAETCEALSLTVFYVLQRL